MHPALGDSHPCWACDSLHGRGAIFSNGCLYNDYKELLRDTENKPKERSEREVETAIMVTKIFWIAKWVNQRISHYFILWKVNLSQSKSRNSKIKSCLSEPPVMPTKSYSSPKTTAGAFYFSEAFCLFKQRVEQIHTLRCHMYTYFGANTHSVHCEASFRAFVLAERLHMCKMFTS